MQILVNQKLFISHPHPNVTFKSLSFFNFALFTLKHFLFLKYFGRISLFLITSRQNFVTSYFLKWKINQICKLWYE
jgi:hypothetical protein